MVASWQLVAEGGVDPGLQEWRHQLLWAAPAIAGVLLIMALVIALVDRWRKRPTRQQLSPGEQLTHFRTLYERGEISPEEFARIRALLTARIKKELEAAPSEPRPPEPSE